MPRPYFPRSLWCQQVTGNGDAPSRTMCLKRRTISNTCRWLRTDPKKKKGPFGAGCTFAVSVSLELLDAGRACEWDNAPVALFPGTSAHDECIAPLFSRPLS